MAGRCYRVLGDLQVVEDETPLDVGSAKQRALLAILLLRAGRVVPTERLVDELWAGEPPPSATATLHGYVSGLRRAIGADVLLTRSPGYVLQVDPSQIDSSRFEALAAEGRAALDADNATLASARLGEALALWRGPALADVAGEPFAVGEATRLDQARLAAVACRAEAELALGHHAEIAVELDTAVADSPLHEELRRLLMLALYRSGRQADALRAFAVGRRALVDELGIEPGPALVAMERAILEHDPAIAWTPRVVDPARAPLRSARVAAPTALVGRARELDLLLGDLDTALGGSGRMVTIGGEPGIGKTTLVAEVAAAAEARGARVVWGHCYEGRGAPAYWPWTQIVDSLLVGDASLVRDALGAGAGDLAQLSPDVARVVPDLVPPPPLDPESARFRVFEATGRFVRGMATAAPVVVVIEDLHWADAPSLQVLAFLAGALDAAPVLVVGTFRTVDPHVDGPLGDVLGALARRPLVRRLDLHGLGVDDIAVVVAGAGVEADDGVVATIERRTHGNPFFVHELLRLLPSDGTAVDVGRLARAVPAGVRDVVRRRVSQLPDAVGDLLRAASVLGQHLDTGVLRDVVDLDDTLLLRRLDDAAASGLVLEDGNGRWRYSHALVNETLYGDLGASRRATLHRRAGEVLEARHGRGPGPHLAAIAAHWAQAVPAAPVASAVELLSGAASWAQEHLAHEQAEEQLRTSLALIDAAPNGPERVELELAVQDQLSGLLLMTRGYAAPGVDSACARMRDLSHAIHPGHHLLVPALWRLSLFYCVSMQLDEALSLGEQLLALATDDNGEEDPSRLLIGHMALGTIHTHRGEIRLGRLHLDRALALCGDGHDEALDAVVVESAAVWTMAFSAWNHWLGGATDLAEDEVLDAVEIARRHGVEAYGTTFAVWFAGLVATLRCDADAALRWCDEGIGLATAGGYGMLVPFMTVNKGWALAALGDVDAGIEHIEAGSAMVDAAGARMLRHVFPAFLADAHLRAGRAHEAARCAERGLLEVEATGERWFEAELHRLHGDALAVTEGRESAEAAYKRAIATAESQHAGTLVARARDSLAALRG